MHTKTLLCLVLLLVSLLCEVHSQNSLRNFVEDYFAINPNSTDNVTLTEIESARKKEKKGGSKYTVPLLFGALLVKSVIFPIAFKAMAVMSSIAVLLSTMSLILSSIIGYVKLATNKPRTSVKVLHHSPHNSWAKDDENSPGNYYTLETADYEADKAQGDRYYYLNKYPYK